MAERIERELLIDASPEDIWEAITGEGWLADEVTLDLTPGGDAEFRTRDEVKSGWIEDVHAPDRLAFWWAVDGEPATRVEITLRPDDELTRLRVVETRPLELLDLVATPLPGVGGRTFGPALVAA
ncbi:MAG TPA: SRPBCC domain-containing protein [Solirubrobacteraceae bacterium]